MVTSIREKKRTKMAYIHIVSLMGTKELELEVAKQSC